MILDLLDDPEAMGLLALMLLHDARQATRIDANGDFVLLEDQDRSLWDGARISEAQSLIERALATRRIGPYVLQAAIADLHARAASTASTDWTQIVALYDVLLRVAPSPVAALNRAAAIAQRDGAEAGLAAVDAAMADGSLDAYALAHAARADMLRKLDQTQAALASYRRALDLTQQPAERRFLQSRLAQLGGDQAARTTGGL